MSSEPYRALCIQSLHPSASDDDIENSILEALKDFKYVSVIILCEPAGERNAYAVFRYVEDAEEAYKLNKDMLLCGKSVDVQPIFLNDPIMETLPHGEKKYKSLLDDDKTDDGYFERGIGRGQGYYRSRGRARGRTRGCGRGGRSNFRRHDNSDSYKKSSANKSTTKPLSRHLFVGGIEPCTTEKDLREAFEPYGTVVNVDRKSSYAFVKFFTLDMALRAKRAMKGKMINGAVCRIGFGNSSPRSCLWVGRIGSWTSEKELVEIFSRYGKVDKFEWPCNMSYAFILFQKMKDARAAYERLQGMPLGRERKRILIEYADLQDMDSSLNYDLPTANEDLDYEIDFNDDVYYGGEEDDLEGGADLSPSNYDDDWYDDRESRERMDEEEWDDSRYRKYDYSASSKVWDDRGGKRERDDWRSVEETDFEYSRNTSRNRRTSSERDERRWERDSDRGSRRDSDRGSTRDNNRGSRRDRDRGSRRDRGRGLGRDNQRYDREDRWSYNRRSRERDDQQSYTRDDQRSYGRDDWRSYKGEDRRSFENEDRRSFEKEDRRSYEREDRRSYERGGRRSFQRDTDRGLGQDYDREFDRDRQRSPKRRSYSRQERSDSSDRRYKRDNRRSHSRSFERGDNKRFRRSNNRSSEREFPRFESDTQKSVDRSFEGISSGSMMPDPNIPPSMCPPLNTLFPPASGSLPMYPPNPLGIIPPSNVVPGYPATLQDPYPPSSLSIYPAVNQPFPDFSVPPPTIRGFPAHVPRPLPVPSNVHIDLTSPKKDITAQFPVVWSGALVLKNSAFVTNMHLLSGSVLLVDSLLREKSVNCPVLKITQRLRLDEPDKVKEVERRVSMSGRNGCSVLLAVPAAAEVGDVHNVIQQRPLGSLGSYLREKAVAAVILLPPGCSAGSQNGILHAFPPCEFARDFLKKEAPELSAEYPKDDHLLVIVMRETGESAM